MPEVTELSYSSSPNALEGFAQSLELVESAFGQTARDLSLKGHKLTVSFDLQYDLVQTINAKTQDASSYVFTWHSGLDGFCAALSRSLKQKLKDETIHTLAFRMDSYGEWSIGRSRNLGQQNRDTFNRCVLDLNQQRADWFRAFVQSEDVLELTLHYPEMPRAYGPFWPGLRFGYLIGRAQNHLWLMSSGLSNPAHPSTEPDWATSSGIGIEVLVRCKPDTIDLMAGWQDQMLTPELIVLDAICGTIIEYNTRGAFDKIGAAQNIELEYYKHSPIHPLNEGTEITLTNAASFGICSKIPSLGYGDSKPLIATVTPPAARNKTPSEISRELIASKGIGLLPKMAGTPDIGR